jgi:DNA mismatch repair protein MutS2
LNQSEQDHQSVIKERRLLQELIAKNEKLRQEMSAVIQKEKHRQEVERLTLSNKLAEEKIHYLKETERKLKSLVIEWRKAEDKDAVVKMIGALLMGQKDKIKSERLQKKIDERFLELSEEVKVGDKVRMRQNRQVGIVKELRGKKALLQVGIMPMLVEIKDLVVVKEKELPKEK